MDFITGKHISRRTMLSRRMLPRRPARPAGDAPPGGGGCALSARNRVGIAADAADAARSFTSLLAISCTRPRPAHLAKVRVRDDAEMSAIFKEGGCIERGGSKLLFSAVHTPPAL